MRKTVERGRKMRSYLDSRCQGNSGVQSDPWAGAATTTAGQDINSTNPDDVIMTKKKEKKKAFDFLFKAPGP